MSEAARLADSLDAALGSAREDGQRLLVAAERGDIAWAKDLLAREASPDAARNEQGLNALMIAILSGQEEMARLLMSAGASAMAESLDGSTALSLAATSPKIGASLAAALAAAGGIDKRDKHGYTPLMSAIILSGDEEKIRALASLSDLSIGFAAPMLHKPEMPILNFARLFGSFSGIDCERIVSHEIKRRSAAAERDEIASDLAPGTAGSRQTAL